MKPESRKNAILNKVQDRKRVKNQKNFLFYEVLPKINATHSLVQLFSRKVYELINLI